MDTVKVSDKELLIEVIASYAGTLSTNLFGFPFGAATTGLVKIGINNILGKNPYKMIIDFLFDKDDNLPDPSMLWGAMKESIDAHPIIITGVKFNRSDVEEIEKLFNSKR